MGLSLIWKAFKDNQVELLVLTLASELFSHLSTSAPHGVFLWPAALKGPSVSLLASECAIYSSRAACVHMRAGAGVLPQREDAEHHRAAAGEGRLQLCAPGRLHKARGAAGAM